MAGYSEYHFVSVNYWVNHEFKNLSESNRQSKNN